MIGLVGACVFVFSYTDGWGDPVAVAARVATSTLVAATLVLLYVRPRPLGPFVPPGRGRIAVYLLCVVAELALIALGSRWLETQGAPFLRPALIAAVVGLHFLPFGWAFAERMFLVLGSALLVCGVAGLLLGTADAASGAATLSGVVMAVTLLAYSLGAFARRGRSQ